MPHPTYAVPMPYFSFFTVRLINFVRFEKINGDFRKINGDYLKINGANWKMISRLLANDCRFRDFTLSLKKKYNLSVSL
jgi:hypothetical protein